MEKHVVFSKSAVVSAKEGRKTEFRFPLRPQPRFEAGSPPFWTWKDCQWAEGGIGFPTSAIEDYAPYKPGDKLYVQEMWAHGQVMYNENGESIFVNTSYRSNGDYFYRADCGGELSPAAQWFRPEVMPREAARIFLDVVDVRVERLQDITSDFKNYLKEGMSDLWKPFRTYDDWFRCVWENNLPLGCDDLSKYGWSANPWVYVVRFQVVN